MERLHGGTRPSTASSPTSESFDGHPPLQVRSADCLSQYQNDLMLKAVRRNAALPSLSITIPPPNGNRGTTAARGMEAEIEKEQEPDVESLEPEPLQKSVKFLAPDSDSDSDHDSEQSSICQSPSWEGYGQKKMEKKKEAERKRKEKEQAERDARAARRKPFSRLSKAPPVSMRQQPALMERSNSAPLLASHRSFGISRVHQLPSVQDESEIAEGQSFDSRSVTPDPSDFLSGTKSNRFLGGLRFEQERKAAAQNALQAQFPDSFPDGLAYGNDYVEGPRQPMQKSYSAGPGMDMSHTTHGTSATKQGSKAHRDLRPPSASRTPQLRHMPGDRGLGQSHSFRRGTSRMPKEREEASNMYSRASHSQESLHTTGLATDRHRLEDGYVRRQRDQNAERALAGFADEQLSYGIGISATKLAGQNKTTPSSTAEHADGPAGEQGDYFALPGHPYSRFSQDDNQPAFMKSRVGTQDTTPSAASVASQEVPLASSGSSATESGSGKKRSLKDAAMAAFHISSTQPAPGAVKVPPYFVLRARMNSSGPAPTSAPTVQTATIPTPANVPRPPKVVHGEYANPGSTRNQQPASRVSEGSSSSSNYDVSPLPSPATTPDTSRPQSARGEVSKGSNEDLSLQDDQRTVRQSSGGSSVASSAIITPRPGRRSDELITEEDRWSRSAMPMDIDFDAQSTVTSSSNSDDVPGGAATRSPKPPALARSHSNPDLSDSAKDPRPLPPPKDQPLSPRRSKTRDRPLERPKTSPTGKQSQEEKELDNGPEQESQHDLKLKRKLRKQKQKPEPEPKPARKSSENRESTELASSITKSNKHVGSANASILSARFMSPIGGFVPSYGFSSNPFFVDFSEIGKASEPVTVSLPFKVTTTQIMLQGTPDPAPGKVTSPAPATVEIPDPTSKQARILAAPEPPRPAIRSTRSPSPPPTHEPRAGPPPRPTTTTTPVSILKPSPPPQQTSSPPPNPAPGSKPHVLSAIPKHLQPQTSTRAVTAPEARMAPIAKMFVECCSCHFYHDMPSKLYECMAKPDAMVEDRSLGISGAITTMVKCPWCQHNMSTKCCAGYAAVVYVKEKLH